MSIGVCASIRRNDISEKCAFSPHMSMTMEACSYSCSSYVGRGNGMQVVELGPDCEFPGVITHEILHALGMFHEHQRPDRDRYVVVYKDNVDQTYCTPKCMNENFDSESTNNIDTLRKPYDFASVMHYAFDEFGIWDGKKSRKTLGLTARSVANELHR